jgi:hypothetical protein
MELTPELLAELKQAIATGQLDLSAVQGTRDGRSPIRPPHLRQLHDLRLAPTKDDPRPTFIWSVDGPRNDPDAHKTHPYPRLLWSADGTEITVHTAAEHQQKVASGYLEKAPGDVVIDPATAMKAMLDGLSPEDRLLVLEGSKSARNKQRIEALLELDDAAFDSVVSALEMVPGAKKKSA